MKCEQIQEQFLSYLDEAMGAAFKAQIEIHLAGCVACREELRSLSELSARLEALPPEEPDPALRPRFAATLEAFRQGMKQGDANLEIGRKVPQTAATQKRGHEQPIFGAGGWEWLRPFRFQLGGLAVACLITIGFRAATPASSPVTSVAKATPPSPQFLLALQEQRRLLDELIAPTSLPIAEQKRPSGLRPRSERPDTNPPSRSAETVPLSATNFQQS